MGLTTAGANAAITGVLSGNYTVRLHNGDPGTDGTANILTEANGYSHQTTQAFSASGGTSDNDSEINFGTATAQIASVSGVTILSGATVYVTDTLDTTRTFEIGDEMRFSAGALSVTIAENA